MNGTMYGMASIGSGEGMGYNNIGQNEQHFMGKDPKLLTKSTING
jgi:hypothetical protein